MFKEGVIIKEMLRCAHLVALMVSMIPLVHAATVCSDAEVSAIEAYSENVPACKSLMDAYNDFEATELDQITQTGDAFTDTASNEELVCPCMTAYDNAAAKTQLDCKLKYFYGKISLYETRAQCLIEQNDLYPVFTAYQVKCTSTTPLNGTSALTGETGVPGCFYACASTPDCEKFSFQHTDVGDQCAQANGCSVERHDDGMEGLFEPTRRTNDKLVWQEEFFPTYRRFLVKAALAEGVICRSTEVMMPNAQGHYCTNMGDGVYCSQYDSDNSTQCIHTMDCTGYPGVDCPGVGQPQITGGFANANTNKERIEQLLERKLATISDPGDVCVAVDDEAETCRNNIN